MVDDDQVVTVSLDGRPLTRAALAADFLDAAAMLLLPLERENGAPAPKVRRETAFVSGGPGGLPLVYFDDGWCQPPLTGLEFHGDDAR